jgi:hypothetical protein
VPQERGIAANLSYKQGRYGKRLQLSGKYDEKPTLRTRRSLGEARVAREPVAHSLVSAIGLCVAQPYLIAMYTGQLTMLPIWTVKASTSTSGVDNCSGMRALICITPERRPGAEPA